MNEATRATHETGRAVRYRMAKARDSLAMWRLRRNRTGNEGISPFFYMSVLQRLAHCSVVAELSGEVVGYVLARPSAAHGAVRLVDLTIDPEQDTAVVAAGLLSRLVRLPAHATAEFIDAEHGARDAVSALLAVVANGESAADQGTALAIERGDQPSLARVLGERTKREESWLE